MDFTNDQSELNHFILQKTIEIIATRNEKTPFTFIVNGLLPEMLQAGHLRPEEPTKELHAILNEYVGEDKIFIVTENANQEQENIGGLMNLANILIIQIYL